MSHHNFRLVFAFVVLLFSTNAFAQNPISWSAKLEPGTVKQGAKAKLVVTAKLDPGWHLYSLNQGPPPRATKVALEEGGEFLPDGNVSAPPAKKAFDPNFQIETETYEGGVSFSIPIKAKPDAVVGATKASAKVTFQVCNDTTCLRPTTKNFEADVTIIAAVATNTSPSPSPSASPKMSPSPSPSVSPSPSPSVSPSPSPSTSPSPSPSVSPTPFDPGGFQSTIPPSDGVDSTKAETITTTSAADLKNKGILNFILLAISSGLLALLTPCVFPMIPITVSYFTKQADQSRGRAIAQSLVYALGIIFTFTGLGLLMTLIAGAAGLNKFAANPWLNLAMAALFFVLALNLFGLFEIRMPSGLVNKLDSQTRQGGGFGTTLLMGLVFTLTSFTCTVAFVGQVLVFAAQGEWFWSIIGMLAFSTAFAFPFFLLSIFPHWLKSLPSSGGWMNSVKVTMGFIELAAGLKFLSNVDLVWGWNAITRNVFLSAWVAIALVAGIYLLGKIQLPMDSPVKSLGVLRMLMSVFFFGLAFYFLTGMFGGNLAGFEGMVPPARNNGNVTQVGSNNSAHSEWIMNYDKALAQAKATNRPVFVNFTGVTCTNCRWMESNMFTDAAVKKALDNFVLAELYTDRQTPEDEKNAELQEKKFKNVGLPLYVMITPDGQELSAPVGLTRDKNEFIKFLQAGASRFGQTG